MRVELPSQHECEEAADHTQQGQAPATIEVAVAAGRRVIVALGVWRGGAVNVIRVNVAVACNDDRQSRRGAVPVRKFVAGEPVHREDREEHCEKGPQRVDIKPMRVPPTRDHAT